MKKFKKIILLGILGLIILVIYICKSLISNQYEDNIINTFEIMDTYDEEINDDKNYIYLHITGEVVNPGIIKVKEGSRLIDVIEAAGGNTENADLNKVNLAFVMSDGQKIYIPSIYDKENQIMVTEEVGNNIIEDSFLIKNNNKVNINTATRNRTRKTYRNWPIYGLKNNKL